MCYSLVGHLYVGSLAAVVVDAAISAVGVHTGLPLCALVRAGLTLIHIWRKGQRRRNKVTLSLNKHKMTNSVLYCEYTIQFGNTYFIVQSLLVENCIPNKKYPRSIKGLNVPAVYTFVCSM